MQRFFMMFIVPQIWNTVKCIEYTEYSHYRVLNYLAFSVHL